MTKYMFIIETTGEDLTQLYPSHICEPFSFKEHDGDVEVWYTSTEKPDALKAILNQDATVKAYHIEDETDTPEEELHPKRGGAREGAGRPKLGETYEQGYQAGYKAAERKKATKLVEKTEQVWKKYEGDTCIAIVQDGKCVRGWMNAQTYGTISTRDGRDWWWIGLSAEELKENHFSYAHTNTRYFGAKSGHEYFTDGEDWWAEWEEDGEMYQGNPVREVEIIKQ